MANGPVQRTRLDNGIRVVTEQMPGVPSVTLGLWVENGSRHERPEQAGISHFLEHLFFKGTDRRSATDIAEEADAVGGVLNAFTGKEYTCYYGKVLCEHLTVIQDLLADIFLHSRFDPEEVERERTVVLQEISQVEDTPDDYVHDLFAMRFWPGHPLGFPVCGREETVSRFQQQDFLAFLAERYQPDRLIVAAAGNLEHQAVVDWVQRQFGHLYGTAHDVGRAYSVYSFLSSYRDAGYVGIYVGTSPEWAAEVVDVILEELQRIKREGLAARELERVKNQLKGNILLGLETSDNRMSRIAKNEIYFGYDISPAEVAARIDAATNDQIIDLAGRLFREEKMALTLLGDLRGHRLPELVPSA